ncbi:hypothetical protein [Brevundimonas sp.]|uniref:hypothetical protein n=1 Tax=Brevundimonas sp. TaxID=1871086 RepID=UPI0028AB6EEA|nr:hypothetical protein [Brevundimonas sp.]
MSQTTIGIFATARRPRLDLAAIWAVKQEFPRASAQFISNKLGVSMEDVRRLMGADQ